MLPGTLGHGLQIMDFGIYGVTVLVNFASLTVQVNLIETDHGESRLTLKFEVPSFRVALRGEYGTQQSASAHPTF